jgi:SAM-dependent methyltransferase
MCPLCGPASARPWIRQAPFAVVRCCGCGLGITWPPPTDHELERYYEPGYYERDHMGAENADAWRERARGILERVAGPVARALDFGAGQGHLVAGLQAHGVQADGVEPLASGRAAAREIHGLALLEDWPDPGAAPYDMVTLVHTLEHVRDPLSVLRAAALRTKPGGLLFIDVPHIGSVEMWRPRWRRRILSLPGHLFHFTPRTLQALVQRAGWDVRDVHLINSEFLEWSFAARARFGGPATGSVSRIVCREPVTATASATPHHRRGGMRRMWTDALLPWIRDRFPGYRFELVAIRPDQRRQEPAS